MYLRVASGCGGLARIYGEGFIEGCTRCVEVIVYLLDLEFLPSLAVVLTRGIFAPLLRTRSISPVTLRLLEKGA